MSENTQPVPLVFPVEPKRKPFQRARVRKLPRYARNKNPKRRTKSRVAIRSKNRFYHTPITVEFTEKYSKPISSFLDQWAAQIAAG